MTPRQIEDYLQDILETISAAQQFTTGMSFEDFKADQKTIFAVSRAIEIVGEATKNIPPNLRANYPQIPWKGISGMRDKVIHQYFGINLQVLWDTLQQDLPTLQPVIIQILKELSQESP